MAYLKNIINYLFSRNPGQNFSFYTELIVLIALLIVAAMVFSQIYKRRKKYDFAFKRLFRKLSGRLVLLAILFAVLTIFRYESIPYFSMRILLYISLLLLFYFIYKTVRTFRIEYPKEKQNTGLLKQTAPKEKKYLPNK